MRACSIMFSLVAGRVQPPLIITGSSITNTRGSLLASITEIVFFSTIQSILGRTLYMYEALGSIPSGYPCIFSQFVSILIYRQLFTISSYHKFLLISIHI